MDTQQLIALVEKMRNWGVVFEKGLSENEIDHIERENAFHFPEDLKAFLSCAMPVWEPGFDSRGLNVVESFPNWRTHASIVMRKSRHYLFEGISESFEYGYKTNDAARYWLENWGPLPDHLSDALAILDEKFTAAPILIPIYSHRFIPSDPLSAGNPVFSVAGTDIIHYGYDLENYFHHEFSRNESKDSRTATTPRAIRFWDDFIYRAQIPRPASKGISLNDVDLDKYKASDGD